MDYVYGACGDAYIFVSAANRYWSLTTGYDVVDDFDWVTYLRDPYSYPTGPSWEGDDSNPPLLAYTDETEYWKAYVHYGIAFLDNGGVCHAGPPIASDETNDPK
jgi:hypothetical protein